VEYSHITSDLFIGKTPRSEDYDELRELGVQLVISMRFERRPFPDRHNSPIEILWLPSFDSPLIPISMRTLQRGVEAALATIAEGGKVYVHCQAGVHRAVAMGSAILIAQGYKPQEAMQLIKQKRENADPDIWYIRRRILKFAETWDPKE
jgi:protein-tyrosine phosphatase